MSTHSDESLVKRLREGWRGDVASDLMLEAADRIENLRARAGYVEAIRRDVYLPLKAALAREALLGLTIEPTEPDEARAPWVSGCFGHCDPEGWAPCRNKPAEREDDRG